MDTIYQSLISVLDLNYVLLLVIGSILGVVFGALPGLTAPMAIAVMLPLTYSMEPKTGLGFLLGLYSGVGYGGAIPAILFNIPGTPAAVMTALDGHALANQGQAGKAIGISTIASFVAGVLSVFCLMLTAPLLSRFALRFGPHEYFAMAVCGLSITSGIIGKSWSKGFWSALLGIVLATVGIDPLTNDMRFSFGNVDLMSGLPVIPILVGMFGLTRVFSSLNSKQEKFILRNQDITGLLPTWKDMREVAKSTLQGTVTGTVIGALPGAGPAMAAVLSYEIEKKTSPKLDRNGRAFGEGRLAGIAAPEAANNSITGGALIPLLTFGIPGSAGVAIMIGALMMYNMTPGPLFFANHTDVVYSIYLSMLISNIFILILCLSSIKLFIKALHIPMKFLMPAILVLCIIGAYSVHNNPFHIVVMVVFGIVGYLFERASIPALPMVLGLILGPIIEINLRQALILEDGNFLMLFARPISGTLLAFAVVVLLGPIIYSHFSVRKGG